MLSAYLDSLQHASFASQLTHCVLGALFLGVVPFAPGLIVDHVRAYRAGR